ncbi:hypothetical protein COOONC_21438 [Cooperia oncophora]
MRSVVHYSPVNGEQRSSSAGGIMSALSVLVEGKKRALFTISFVWVFSFVCNIGSLFIFDSVPYRNQWTCDTTKGPLTDFFYQLYVTLVVLLFIPLCAMVSLYGHVIYTLSTVIVTDDNPVVQQSIMQEGLKAVNLI